MITQSNNERQQQLVKGKTFVVVEKYTAARNVLLNSTLSVSSLGTDNPDGIDFINCRVQYEDDFIHVGDVVEIVEDCNSLCKQSAKVIDSTEEYIVGSGFLIQKNGKFFFMENQSSIGKINFMYTIAELGNRELDEELQEELRMFVKQFNSEELECLKRAIRDDAEGEMSKFILMRNQKKEQVELFFKTNKEFLRQLDFKQDQDLQGCDFKNYSPPKGKLESYNKLSRFLKKEERFKIAAKNFPTTKFTNIKELLFWNALFKCLKETYSLPENLYETLSDKKDKKDKKDNLKPFLTNTICSSAVESRNLLMHTKLNRLRVMYFIIEEPNESKFRLNTKCKKGQSEYITEEFWFGCDDYRFPLSLRTELMENNDKIQHIIPDLNIADEENVPSNETTGFQTVRKKQRKGRFGKD